MATITYEWKVVSIDTIDDPLPGTAVFAVFNVIARDEEAGTMALESGAVNLLPANPDSFVPFDNLDADVRAQMVKDALSQEGKDSPEVYEARLAEKLTQPPAAEPTTHTFE